MYYYALNSLRGTTFNVLRHLELKGSFGKPEKDIRIIICGERMKVHLDRGAHMPVQPCPTPMG